MAKAKRQQLGYNKDELTSNLRQSAGRGVDAFFPDPDSPTVEQDLKRGSSQSIDWIHPEADEDAQETNGASEPALRSTDEDHTDEQRAADRDAVDEIEPEPIHEASTDNSTHARTGARANTSPDASNNASLKSPDDAATDESMHARADARMQRPNDQGEKADIHPTAEAKRKALIETIKKRIRAKRHLSSFTFRYRSNELEELDIVVDQLNQDDEIKISKNDVVRTALNWLLTDYNEHKQESVLACVLTDT